MSDTTSNTQRRQLLSGARVTSLGTLISRVLGMVRDVVTAGLLGMSSGGIMDAFVIAFRVPNLFRRLFGEGALTASYLPVLTARLEEDRAAAWRLASVTLTWLVIVLSGVVIVAEAVCGVLWMLYGDRPGMPLLLGLSAVMLPYMIFICAAAQVAATLHALSSFRVPAMVPIVLNVCWIAAALLIAPRFAGDKEAQAYVLAGCVLVAGVLQVAVQLPALRRHGFRYHYDMAATRDDMRRIVSSMGPMMLGLAVTQINTLADSLIAWALAAPEPAGPIAWLPGELMYPLTQGAASAIYYGERLYQFPVGILGIAVATAIFPLLSRHAARGDRARLGEDLTLGLRLVVYLALPATVGLVLLSEPITRLLFERGEWTAKDTPRTARMIAGYGLGVWAYCALPVIIRGYYAIGDRVTPVRVGLAMVALNLTLNLTLVWPLGEFGLAVSTAACASVQLIVLTALFSRRSSPLAWKPLGLTLVRTLPSAAVMAAAGYATLTAMPPGDLLRVAVTFTVCVTVFFLVSWLLGGREWTMLFGREGQETERKVP
jgi:putative peptidoglycan lipid II flippase